MLDRYIHAHSTHQSSTNAACWARLATPHKGVSDQPRCGGGEGAVEKESVCQHSQQQQRSVQCVLLRICRQLPVIHSFIYSSFGATLSFLSHSHLPLLPFRASRDCRDVQDWCRTFRRIYVRHNSTYLAYILLFLSHLGTRTECTYLHSCSTCPTGFLLRVQHTLRPHRSLPLEYPPLSSQRRYP